MKRTAIVIGTLISMWTAGPVFASTNTGATPVKATPMEVAGATPSAASSTRVTETSSYAAREKAAPELANFKGGDGAGIYIGGSTLAVVLLIVLLVVLL